MITLPPPYVAIPYPGYFWNTDTNKLYSIKIGGTLKLKTYCRPNKWNNYVGGYRISHQGIERIVSNIQLSKTQPGVDHIISEGEESSKLSEEQLTQVLWDFIHTRESLRGHRITYILGLLAQDFKGRYDENEAAIIAGNMLKNR